VLSNHCTTQPTPVLLFGALEGPIVLESDHPRPGTAQAKTMGGRPRPIRTDATTTSVARPTSSLDRWTG
jgi:hypothetical protein